MKKIILTTALLLALLLTLTACSESRPYTWAIIVLDGKTVAEGHVDAWTSYGDSVVAIEIDGKRYRTNYNNVILMEEPPTTHDQPKTTEAHA